MRGNPDAQLVAIYLMTCPSSEMHGVFYCPIPSIIHEIGFDKPLASPFDAPSEGETRVKQALLALEKLDFLAYDYENEFVFVKEFAKWQISETLKAGDKRVVGIKNAIESMPEPLRSQFIERYNEPFSLGLRTSPIEAPSKPHRSQEQEQEQDIYIHAPSERECVSENPKEEKPRKNVSVKKPEGVEQDDWDAYLQLRKQKRAPITNRALALLESEGKKAGMTIQQVIVTCLEHSWQGFKAEWLTNQPQPQTIPQKKNPFAVKAPSKDDDGWSENAKFVQGVFNAQ